MALKQTLMDAAFFVTSVTTAWPDFQGAAAWCRAFG